MNMYKGSIALTTMIIISSLLLMAGLTTVLTAIDLRNATANVNRAQEARLNGWTCLEEAVQRVKYDVLFTGDITLLLSDGGCVATVTDDASIGVKAIEINATADEFTYTVVRRVDVSDYPFELLD